MHKTLLTILAQIEAVVIGKPHECRLALACLLAQGHLLSEDNGAEKRILLTNTVSYVGT
ncbi:MAG: hypothetical protein HRT51_19620 [Colwellia sp.]|nr:hypothetical protein [Colwellia sp.]